MHHLLDALSLPLFAAAALVFVSVLAGVVSTRAGFSLLLVFLVAGMLAGKDGPGGFSFNDFRLAFWVGNVALAVILLDGGLRTQYSTFRTGLKPSVWLATLGVVVCAGLTGAAARWLLDLPWPLAIVVHANHANEFDASVDAAMARLRDRGVRAHCTIIGDGPERQRLIRQRSALGLDKCVVEIKPRKNCPEAQERQWDKHHHRAFVRLVVAMGMIVMTVRIMPVPVITMRSMAMRAAFAVERQEDQTP